MPTVRLALLSWLALTTTAEASTAPVRDVITEAAVTDVRYACRIGDGFNAVPRDPKLPVFVVRLIIGERVLYELHARSRDQGKGTILLATCEYLVAVPGDNVALR